MITLAELGTDGLRRQIEAQNREQMTMRHGGAGSDVPGVIPSPVGIGGDVSRKIDASQRIMIEQERHAALLRREVHRLYNSEYGRSTVSKYVRVTRNVLNRVTDALAVVYERPPVRGFTGSPRMTKAWRDAVLEEGQFNEQASQWARYAFITNVVHVIPQVIDRELSYVEILPHAADVVFDPGDVQPSILVYLVDGGDHIRVAVDNERFWYLDENYKIVSEFVHGYRDLRGRPMQPWIEWRVRPRLSSMDYWQRGRGRQLVESTLKQGVVQAAMDAVRQVNNSKQQTLQAGSRVDDDIPPGQLMSPEFPLVTKNGAVYSVHDLVTPVTAFVEDLDADMESLAASYGVTRGTFDTDASKDAFADYVSLSRARDKMIPPLRRADRETSIKTAIIMRADGHPASSKLRPKQVRERLELEYHQLTFAERPSERFAAWREELSLGLADYGDLRMRQHPSEDRDTANANVEATVKTRGKIAAMMAAHNTPADAGENLDTVAQLNGRLGGSAQPGQHTPDGDDDGRNEQQRNAG